MQLLVWENRFSVGIREFDQHHKILFEMINSLIIAKEEKSDIEVVRRTMEQLQNYTIFHFAAEESMMEYFEFEGVEDHALEHQTLLDEVNEFRARLDAHDDVSIDEVLNFLARWLLDHTLGMDQLYSPFLSHRVE